jgi:hypothetical protein
LYYAFMFFKVLFEDFFKGFQRKKLSKVLMTLNQSDSATLPFDAWGNLIVQNTNSRCGGLKNEWQRDLNLSQFAHQKADGRIIRQNG